MGATLTTCEAGRVRLAMVTPRYHPFTGGVETHVHEVATRLGTRGFEITVLTTDLTGRLPEREEGQGVTIRRYRAWRWLGDLHWAPGLFGAVVGGGWDLVHVQGIHTLVPPLAMTAARRGLLPYLVSFHTGGHSSRLRRALRPVQWRLLRPLLVHAGGLVAVGEFEAGVFQRALRLPRERFTVIRNGFEVPLPPAEGEAGLASAVARAGPVILSIGRLERYKGHHRVIRAMETVLRVHPGAELHVVGTGPYEPQLHRLARESPAGAHVYFVNFPPERRADLGRLLTQANLVTLLSEYEAHPVAVMEAAGLGRPVLVAANSGLHELAEQGIAHEVSLERSDAEIGELVVELLSRTPRPAPAELPGWEVCADRLADLYRSILRLGEVSRP